MSKFTLDDILNAVSIPLEIDGVEFRLVPMSSRAIAAWNRVLFTEPPDEASVAERLEHAEQQRAKQLQLMADHMRGCVTEGKKSKVTPEWLGDAMPQTVLQEFAVYFVEGRKPSWAGETGK